MSSDNLSLLYVGLGIATVVLAGVSLMLGRHASNRRRRPRISLSYGVTPLEKNGKPRSVFQIVVQNHERAAVSIKACGFIVGGRRDTCRDPRFQEQVAIAPGQATRLDIPLEQCRNGQPFVEPATGKEVRQQQPAQVDSCHRRTHKLNTILPIRLKDPVVEETMQQGLVLQAAGKNRKAISLLEGAVALTSDGAGTARLLNCSAANDYRLGDYAQAQTSRRAALKKAHGCGAEHEEGAIHWILAESALRLGALGMAAEHFKEDADHDAIAGDAKASKAIDRLVRSWATTRRRKRRVLPKPRGRAAANKGAHGLIPCRQIKSSMRAALIRHEHTVGTHPHRWRCVSGLSAVRSGPGDSGGASWST